MGCRLSKGSIVNDSKKGESSMYLKKNVVLAGLFAAAFAFGLASRDAKASLNVTCNVSLVAWARRLVPQRGASQLRRRLVLRRRHHEQLYRLRSIDAVKAWESLAQASLLSGKKLYIQYDTGSCISYARLTNPVTAAALPARSSPVLLSRLTCSQVGRSEGASDDNPLWTVLHFLHWS